MSVGRDDGSNGMRHPDLRLGAVWLRSTHTIAETMVDAGWIPKDVEAYAGNFGIRVLDLGGVRYVNWIVFVLAWAYVSGVRGAGVEVLGKDSTVPVDMQAALAEYLLQRNVMMNFRGKELPEEFVRASEAYVTAMRALGGEFQTAYQNAAAKTLALHEGEY